MPTNPEHPWPDALIATDPVQVPQHLTDFWRTLHDFGDVLSRNELVVADELLGELRALVIRMMLALNGIQRPPATRHLNTYLGESQRRALERTLLRPEVSQEALLGQAVALVVIYQWYAPQLAARFNFEEPIALQAVVWRALRAELPDWPATISTDPVIGSSSPSSVPHPP